MKDILFKSNADEWETPQDLYDQLNQEFAFTLDPCSSDENHKTVLYYTKQENGMEQSWGGVQSVLQSTIQRGKAVGAESIP